MAQSLPVLAATEPARTCVWVDVGVLSYRLCNRGFACESCPLDAALRSDPRLTLRGGAKDNGQAEALWCFPCDRLYADGHVWAQVIRAGRVRTGIDACAARLLPQIHEVRGIVQAADLARGEPLCTLSFDGGELPLRSPVSGRVCRWNVQLITRPELVRAEPYGGGWISEIVLSKDSELAGLLHADAAAEQARLTARRFGRQASFGLLALKSPEESWLAPALLEATRQAVGAAAYRTMVCEALH